MYKHPKKLRMVGVEDASDTNSKWYKMGGEYRRRKERCF